MKVSNTYTFTALTADTTGAQEVSISDCAPDGYLGFYATGTFGSGTLKVQVSPVDSGNVWCDLPSASWTSAAYKHLQTFARRVRLVLSGSTSASITVYMTGPGTSTTITNS